ncbi:MAG: hypothetical protein WB511_14815 [Nitrososphaeraceae archaeon]
MSSEYEENVGKLIYEKEQLLEKIKNDKSIPSRTIQSLVLEIETLQSLYDNYNLGMNYFRRAKGGRSGLRE